jgi:hypothetical protein
MPGVPDTVIPVAKGLGVLPHGALELLLGLESHNCLSLDPPAMRAKDNLGLAWNPLPATVFAGSTRDLNFGHHLSPL